MRRTFLTLVRSGLWNTPVDPTPFSSMNSADWEEIYQLARTQALLAITFDGVLSLPADLPYRRRQKAERCRSHSA